MAVLIGSATTVDTTLFPSGGITSINFGLKANFNRLWQLGSWSPYDTQTTQQRELSLVGYGKQEGGQGGSQSFDVTPTLSCSDATSVSIAVNMGACGVVIDPFTDDFFPSSYSYSKDNLGFGTESWSFTSKPIIDTYNGSIYILRGIAQGQVLTGDGMMAALDTGVVVDDAASRDSNGDYIESGSGSVAAGTPGIGDYSVQREVIVTSVGASEGKQDGLKGASNVSIPNTTLYL